MGLHAWPLLREHDLVLGGDGLMPAEVVAAQFCADYWSVFKVPSSTDPTKVYTVMWGGGEGPAFCDCRAFKYSDEENKHCKHIDRTFKEGCFWNPQWYEGGTRTMRPEYITGSTIQGSKCPGCGGPTIGVRIAV